MLKLSRSFTKKFSFSQFPAYKFTTTSQNSQTKSKTLFIFPNESHILSQHMRNWENQNCDHTIQFEENNKNLDKIILEQKPKILVLSDNKTMKNITHLNPELEWIHFMNSSVNYEDTLIRISGKPNVKFTTSRMIVNHALSEYIISMAFYHLKALRFLQTRNELKNIATVPMKRLEGSSFLFLGYDYALFDTFTKIKQAFNCKITIADNLGDPTLTKEIQNKGINVVPLNRVMSLLAESDIIVNSLPHEYKKNKILAYKEFREMPNRACFINIGDFDQIDELALMEALINSKILGASVDLDTLPDPKNPLFDCDRLVLTYNNSDFYGLKWIDTIKFWNENLERFSKGEKVLGIVDKKSGRHIYQ